MRKSDFITFTNSLGHWIAKFYKGLNISCFQIVSGTFILLFGFIPNLIYACDCEPETNLDSALHYADYVVVGEIISLQYVDVPESVTFERWPEDSITYEQCIPYRCKIRKYSILLDHVFKGETSNHILSVYTGINPGNIGYEFQIGESYLVFGMKETYFDFDNKQVEGLWGENILWTNDCMHTVYYFDANMARISDYFRENE